MKLKIILWNVRGVIETFLKLYKVDLVCLQETKIKETTKKLVRSLGGGRFVDWVACNSEGALGGMLIFWDSRFLQILDKEKGQIS